jgi:prolyl-tRNA editing enzyme YbaK/EbsC (Cys-tRNA(Pro) deacylase)
MENDQNRGSLSNSAQRVQAALEGLGLSVQVVELPASTRTAQEAAQAIGCYVGQIAKSLVFTTVTTERPILVVTSGLNRVDEKVIGVLIGEEVRKADANFVRQHTGYAIGGVPPVGHLEAIETFIDCDLLVYDEIWAAAGTPCAVFKLTGDNLVMATMGKVVPVN